MPDIKVPASMRDGGPARPPLVSSGLPILGHGLAFGKDPLGFVRACQRKYGDVFTLRFPQGTRTFLMDPLDYPAYFKNRELSFTEVGAEIGSRAFGFSLEDARRANIEEISHQINVYMKGDPLQVMSERMQEKLVERLRALPVGTWRQDALHRWANEFIFATSTEALFGEGVYSEALKQAYTTVDKAIGGLLDHALHPARPSRAHRDPGRSAWCHGRRRPVVLERHYPFAPRPQEHGQARERRHRDEPSDRSAHGGAARAP